jgi:hypothetical protein
MKICVDFDGTIVQHKYPFVGEDIGAFKWLKSWQEAGASLILFTMRSGEALQEAVDYCEENGIKFYGINTNPRQSEWTTSPKVFAQLYVDDAAFGTPLIHSQETRPFVDWSIVGPEVLKIIEKNV